MRHPLWLVMFLLTTAIANGKSKDQYAISSIPKYILKDANAVIRNYTMTVIIPNDSTVIVKRHYILTVLNNNSPDYRHIIEPYSIQNKIDSLCATLYDANGIKLLTTSTHFFFDKIIHTNKINRSYKEYSFNYNEFPYTIEVFCQTTQNNTFTLPVWKPEFQKKISIENASLKVVTNKYFSVRFQSYHIKPQKSGMDTGNTIIQRWILMGQSVKKLANTDYSIHLAPDFFNYYGYMGRMNTWENLGLFFFHLNNDKDSLSAGLKISVHRASDNLSDKKQKIFSVFNKMFFDINYNIADNDIHSWQTNDADFVAMHHYGDCKALCNYMIALLKEINIKAYPVHIYAGENVPNINKKFPSQQFNHIIVCVPLVRDTLWLDCANHTSTLNSFIDNRDGLLITENGGYITHIPAK